MEPRSKIITYILKKRLCSLIIDVYGRKMKQTSQLTGWWWHGDRDKIKLTGLLSENTS